MPADPFEFKSKSLSWNSVYACPVSFEPHFGISLEGAVGLLFGVASFFR